MVTEGKGITNGLCLGMGFAVGGYIHSAQATGKASPWTGSERPWTTAYSVLASRRRPTRSVGLSAVATFVDALGRTWERMVTGAATTSTI